MKIFISEYDRHNAYRAAILNIARIEKIEDCEYKSNIELYLEIQKIQSSLLEQLDKYLIAYDNWFIFYDEKQKVEKQTEKNYDLSDREKLELASLINSRQDNLEKLQKQFDELKSK